MDKTEAIWDLRGNVYMLKTSDESVRVGIISCLRSITRYFHGARND